ncbi:MAG TPA: Rieske (2Fe-2S) protein [Nocardioidaceae bacterium]
MTGESTPLGRRTVLRGVAVGGVAVPLLAACGGSDEPSSGGEGSGAPSDAGSPSQAEAELATSEVPVGGGTIIEDEMVVVTQPAEGDFKAFSAVCTHQGCPVQEINDGQIQCKCHGSAFSIEDGSVVNGPASRPLETKSVTVDGETVRVS